MKKISILVITGILLLIVSCKKKQKETPEATTEDVVKVTEEVMTVKFALEAKSESNATGEASFTEKNGKVTFEARLKGLTPGVHAIHIHEKADCASPDGKSTGGHWNPTYAQHGKWGSADGFHKGDIGNFTADENGNGSITLTTDEWCIGCDDDTKNVLGKSIIVHAGIDDFVSQPTGDAGGRVSCGGIIK